MSEWFRKLLQSAPERPLPAPLPPSRPDPGEDPYGELRMRLTRLESDQAALRIEWAELMDKVSRWFSRQAGRKSAELRDAIEDKPQPPQQAEADMPPAEVREHRKAQLRAALRARGA